MRSVRRPFAVFALAALLASSATGGCATGCDQEMEHGGSNTDAAAVQDGGAGTGDAGLPLCPDAGPPPDASPYDAGMFDAGVIDAGPPPDAGPPTCRYPWDAGPGSR
jgi:hypothetical protein